MLAKVQKSTREQKDNFAVRKKNRNFAPQNVNS
jgi:hypothetical protein